MLTRILLIILICSFTVGCASGSVSPQPGAELSGTIDIRADQAKTAQIYLTVSEDGTGIDDITVRLMEVHCAGVTTSLVNLNVTVNSPFDGKIFSIDNEYIGVINGEFISPTNAAGNIHLILKKNVSGTQASCDLGLWKWRAAVK